MKERMHEPSPEREYGHNGPVIDLHLFRHSEKESGKIDNEIALTPNGRKMAQDQALDITNPQQSVAFGSPKKRTQETALYHMLGAQDGVTADYDYKTFTEQANKDLKVGSKVGVDKNLDFPDIFSSQYKTMVFDSIKKNEYMDFLIHDSNKLGRMFESETETYDFKASQIAKIIKKYIGIYDRWENLKEDEQKQYNNKLERFLGTHGGIQECFLAKVIEMIDGEDEREKFIQAIPGNGFDFNEGMKVRITKIEGDKKLVNIEYKGEKYNLSKSLTPEFIDEIVNLADM